MKLKRLMLSLLLLPSLAMADIFTYIDLIQYDSETNEEGPYRFYFTPKINEVAVAELSVVNCADPTNTTGIGDAIGRLLCQNNAQDTALAGKMPTFTSWPWADVSGKPSFGTAALVDVPASGDAASGQAVKGNDSRLSDSREPTTHSHTASQISDSTVTGRAVLTAVDAAEARTAIGAGTGNGSGTVTSVGVTSSNLTVTGSPITASGSIAVSLPNVVTAGSCSSVTVDAQGRVTACNNRSINNAPARGAYLVSAINAANGFQISATRDALASYSITIQVTPSGLLAGASVGYVVYEICPTNSATGTDWIEVGRWTDGQTFSSLLTLASTQPIGSDIGKLVPAGYYVRFRSVNVSGTPTYTYNSGQEVQL